MKKVFLLFFTVCLVFPSVAQNNSPKSMVKNFFAIYEKDPMKAIDNLFATNKWIDPESNMVKEIKSNLETNVPRLGQYLGHRMLGQSSLGKALNVRVYLVRYERKPLRFVFHIYRSRTNWIIYRFNFDDFLFEDMEENMKFNYLNNLN